MGRLSTIISLALALLLFPPAVLALISNNAVPGDATYPIKRILEDGVFTVASITPLTKAWFAKARSDRRFEEFSTLLAEGKSASGSLNELLVQTETAASEVEKIDDVQTKQELINKLSNSIDKYDQKLEEVSPGGLPAVEVSETPVATPQVVPSPTSTPIINPKPYTSAVPTAVPTSTPKPSGISKPSEIPKPSAAIQPPSIQTPINRQETENAKKKLEEIKKRLKRENSHLTPLKEERSGSKVNNDK